MVACGQKSPKFVQQIGQLDSRPKCGARTRTGMPCRRAAVRGVGRCPLHGGGAALKRRYEAELHNSKPGKRQDWLLKRLAKTARNREREYQKTPPNPFDRAAQEFHIAVKEGRTTIEARARWVRAVTAVRPYRLDNAMPMIHEAVLGKLGRPTMAATLLAGHLALNETEMVEFYNELGLPNLSVGVF